MKKLFAIISIVALLIAIFACEEKEPTTLEEHLELAAETGKPVLVDFYTDW